MGDAYRIFGSEKAPYPVKVRSYAREKAPQKYHAKSLSLLRAKYQAASADTGLRALLEAAGAIPCLA
jgi:hypothetical protein